MDKSRPVVILKSASDPASAGDDSRGCVSFSSSLGQPWGESAVCHREDLEMMGRTATHVLKVLLEMAQEPSRWRSVNDLAAAQALPAPYLEQLLLRLRRAGLIQARRGRKGGYRLVGHPAELTLARVLAAAGVGPMAKQSSPSSFLGMDDAATSHVALLLQQRLSGAVDRELNQLTLEELLFDLRSARASLSPEGGLILG